MIDRKFIGLALPEFSARVEAGALRFFAKAIGQTDPIYVDEAAAREAGHPALPLPPTYLLSLQILQPSTAWRQTGVSPKNGSCLSWPGGSSGRMSAGGSVRMLTRSRYR